MAFALLSIGVVMAGSASAQSTIFKQVQANGTVIYTDKPDSKLKIDKKIQPEFSAPVRASRSGSSLPSVNSYGCNGGNGGNGVLPASVYNPMNPGAPGTPIGMPGMPGTPGAFRDLPTLPALPGSGFRGTSFPGAAASSVQFKPASPVPDAAATQQSPIFSGASTPVVSAADRLSNAQSSYDAALSAQALGKVPQGGERNANVNGMSRLNAKYAERQVQLQAAVDMASENLEAASSRRR